MSEQLEACACGSTIKIMVALNSVWCFCESCGRRSMTSVNKNLAIAAWNADMKAIKAARDAEPKPQKNRVYPGNWFAVNDKVCMHDEGGKNSIIVTIPRPDNIHPTDGHAIAQNTAKLMAASKHMHQLLWAILNPRGGTSPDLAEIADLLDHLDLGPCN